MSTTTSVVRHQPSTALSITDPTVFEIVTKQAAMLARSTIIPESYRDQPANVLVALEYAYRLGASVLAVMQNLDVINGRPGLRSTFLIATVNASGRFTPLRFRFQGEEGTDSWGCRAVAKDKSTGEECVGPLITVGLAKQEGWYDRKGSKWKTSTELMLTYRSASWWTRIYCPELALGLHTADEIEDAEYTVVSSTPSAPSNAAAVLTALHTPDIEPEPEPTEAAAPVEEAKPESEAPAAPAEAGGSDEPKVPAGCADLHKKYIAGLDTRGMGPEDVAAFQERLHRTGLTQSADWSTWTKQDYRSALVELTEIPVVREAES